MILSVDYGIIDGMDVLVSRAYGRKDYNSWEIHLNQCRYSIFILAIPQFIVILFFGYIFDILGQPAEISYYAWIFLLISFPGILWFALITTNYWYDNMKIKL